MVVDQNGQGETKLQYPVRYFSVDQSKKAQHLRHCTSVDVHRAWRLRPATFKAETARTYCVVESRDKPGVFLTYPEVDCTVPQVKSFVLKGGEVRQMPRQFIWSVIPKGVDYIPRVRTQSPGESVIMARLIFLSIDIV